MKVGRLPTFVFIVCMHLFCMIEALAANGTLVEGLRLTHELQDDQKAASLVNAVIYD